MDCLFPLIIAHSAPNLSATAQRLLSGDRQPNVSTSTTPKNSSTCPNINSSTASATSSASSCTGIVEDPSSDIKFPSASTKMASNMVSTVRRNQNPPSQRRFLEIMSSSEHSTAIDTTGSDSDSSASSRVYSPSSDYDDHTHNHNHQHDYPTTTMSNNITNNNDAPLDHQMRDKLQVTHKANSASPSTSRKTRKSSPMKSTHSARATTPPSLVHKPYMCRVDPYCAKVFRDASTRTRHEKVHSPNRYPCGVCGVEYSRKDNRNRHEAKCTSTRHSKSKSKSPQFDTPSKLVSQTTELVNQAELTEKLTGRLSEKQLQRMRPRSKVFRKTTRTQRSTPSSPLASTSTLAQFKPSSDSQSKSSRLSASDKNRKRAFMINGVLYKIQSQAILFGGLNSHSSHSSGSDNATSPTLLPTV